MISNFTFALNFKKIFYLIINYWQSTSLKNSDRVIIAASVVITDKVLVAGRLLVAEDVLIAASVSIAINRYIFVTGQQR